MSRILFYYFILLVYLPILWMDLEEWESEIKDSWEIVFWWHDFLNFTWLYIITFNLFSVLCQRRYCCWNIGSELATWKIVTIVLCKGGRKCKNKFFNQSFLHPFVFYKIKLLCQLFFAMAQLPALWMCQDISQILPIPNWIFNCFSKTVIKALKQCVKFVQT